MSKKLISALVLIGLAVVLLILNRGSVSLDLGFKTIGMAKSFAFLGFLIVGFISGILIK